MDPNTDTGTGEADAQEKSKIVVKTLGNPKAVTALPDGENALLLGTIIGRVTGSKIKTMPNGDAFEGLVGNFEATPAKPNKDGVISPTTAGICYLPGGFQEGVLETLKAAQASSPGASVEFAYEVYSEKSDNKAGYSFMFKPLIKVTNAGDPLAQLRAAVAERKQRALQAPDAAKGAKGKQKETAPA